MALAIHPNPKPVNKTSTLPRKRNHSSHGKKGDPHGKHHTSKNTQYAKRHTGIYKRLHHRLNGNMLSHLWLSIGLDNQPIRKPTTTPRNVFSLCRIDHLHRCSYLSTKIPFSNKENEKTPLVLKHDHFSYSLLICDISVFWGCKGYPLTLNRLLPFLINPIPFSIKKLTQSKNQLHSC